MNSGTFSNVPEFIYDLRNPNTAFSSARTVPLMERDPLLFWKSLSLILAVAVLGLLGALAGRGP